MTSGLAFPSLATVSPGQPITSALWMAQLYNGLTYLSQSPIGSFSLSTTPSSGFASGAWTPVPQDTTVLDSYGGHSNSTNNSRYTAQQPAWYHVVGQLAWQANTTGSRCCAIYKNGAQYGALGHIEVMTNTIAANGTFIECVGLVQLAAGDYVEIWGMQTSGGTLYPTSGSAMEVLAVHL